MYIIYKTTNKINGKFYIGVTNGNNQWYKGSGTALKKAIKQYGVKNFETVILESFDTETEAFKRESEIVTDELVKDRNCYNIKVGGKGGAGQAKTNEHKEKLSQSIKEKYKQGIYDNAKVGRKPVMNKEEVISLVKEIGIKKTSIVYGIEYEKFRHRYYRYLKG